MKPNTKCHMKPHKIILSLIAVLLFSSCAEFLDIKPYGKTIPKTREEFKALIDNVLEGIDKSSTGFEQIVGGVSLAATMEECADNLETNLTDYNAGGNLLTTYVGSVLNGKQSVYQNLYENIRTANIVLDGYGTEAERKDSDLIGTCYALRGVCYYQLLRQFCAPAGTEDATLGVPLVTEFNLEAQPGRSGYVETSAQVEADLHKALSYHIQDKMYRFNDDVLKAYLARLYHWTGQWQKAYDYAMEVVENHPLLDSLEYRQMIETERGLVGNRLIMGDLLGSGMGASTTMQYIKARPISKRFLDLFPEGSRDVRYAIAVGNRRRSMKIPFSGIRSAEMYLIAMEAKAQLGQATDDAALTKEAMQMLLTLRRLRCPKNPVLALAKLPDAANEYIRVDATGRELTPLMYNILRERRKEMYMENGDRFFELKRNGRPEFWIANKGMKYWTRKYMYTFPLPVGDTYVQPSLIQNPGYEEVE